MQKRAYFIIENNHGWSIEPAVLVLGEYRTPKPRACVFSFSRITQALWWLSKHVKETDYAKALETVVQCIPKEETK